MKTKKILAIVITCLLLIGAAVGITVSAAEEPTVSIHTANLSYEGAIRILYTLDDANVNDDQTIKVVFSDDADVIAPAVSSALNDESYDYVGEKVGVMNIDGTEYPVVLSDGFAPGEMANKVYAIPVVVNVDNTVAAVGEQVEFSIYDYCMARFGGACTDDQYNLYTSLLDFGAAVQTAEWKSGVTGEPTVWADAYYGLKTMAGDGTVEVKTFRAPTEHDVVAPKGYEGFAFEAFTDKAGVAYEGAVGNRLTVNVNKPGYTYVKYTYGDTAIDTEGKTATVGTPAVFTNPGAAETGATGWTYVFDADITFTDGAATLALDTGIATVNLSASAGMITVNDGTTDLFTMASGSNLRVEYTVISTSKFTGSMFFYVDGAYVAKSDVTSTANTAFASATVTATEGEIAVTNVIMYNEASDVLTTLSTTDGTTISYEHDGTDKYIKYAKPSDATTAGWMRFGIDTDTGNAKTVFETKMKLSGAYLGTGWRNTMTFMFSLDPSSNRFAQFNIKITNNTIYLLNYGDCETSLAVATAELPTPITADEWFDFKMETVSGTGGNEASIKFYINGDMVYERPASAFNATTNSEYKSVLVRYLRITPIDSSSGSIYLKDAKFYTVTE